jgi:hypothetical protein
MTLEDRVCAAMRAVAGTVDDVRPLSLPPAPQPRGRERHRWQRRWQHGWQQWAAPLTAAAVVVAIGIALAIVHIVPNGRSVTPPRLAVSAYVPAYYVAIAAAARQTSPDRAVVGDTRTGARLATISPPSHDTFSGVTGAADDRTFVLGVMAPLRGGLYPVGKEGSQSWYLLHITPGTVPLARLTRLPIPATPADAWVYGMALSPDGTKLAVALQQFDASSHPDLLRIYSVATGALLRTWSGPVPGTGLATEDYVAMSWTADGRMLAFGYGAGVRLLYVTRPGRGLLADSRLVFSPAHICHALAVTPDGKTVICSAITIEVWTAKRTPTAWNEFLEYSTATGKLTHTLYGYEANYLTSAGDFDCVLWASAPGDILIGCLNAPHHPLVGLLTQGRFTPLSFRLPGGAPILLPTGIAW